jgi:hypothetical protein
VCDELRPRPDGLDRLTGGTRPPAEADDELEGDPAGDLYGELDDGDVPDEPPTDRRGGDDA